MTPIDREAVIMQRCLARAVRRASIRQRARAQTMRHALAAVWQRAAGRQSC